MLSLILTCLVALIHAYIAVLEMFMWESKRARRVFGTTAELAAQTTVMAANQGLYNAFLAAGLIFGLVAGLPAMVIFLLICVGVAGAFGLMSGIRSAFIFQTIPAVLALLAGIIGW